MAKLISEIQKYSINGIEINFISQPFDGEEFLVGVYAVKLGKKIKLTETDAIKQIFPVGDFDVIEGNMIVTEATAIAMSNIFNVALRSGKYDEFIIEEAK